MFSIDTVASESIDLIFFLITQATGRRVFSGHIYGLRLGSGESGCGCQPVVVGERGRRGGGRARWGGGGERLEHADAR